MIAPRRFLPSVSSLLALEAVERLGSATLAAGELSLTHSAISRQLRHLEDQIGVTLFERTGRALVLTPAGRDYAAAARGYLQDLARSSLKLRAAGARMSLNLAVLPAFGAHWLLPRLKAFTDAHPEVTVNLSTRLRPFDFAETGFDAAIHYGRKDWPGVSYLKLMDEQVLAVAAPSLLPQPLPKARDILGFPLLQLDSRPGDWSRWLARHGEADIRPPAMLFDQFATMAQAAIHGLGLALMPVFLIEEDLAAGRLVPAFGGPVPALGSYYLVWPGNRPERAALVGFRDWLCRTEALSLS